MNKIIMLLMVVLLAASCQSTKNDGVLTTSSGVKYEKLRNGSGDSIQVNDIVEFNVDAYDQVGTQKFSSKDMGQPARINIADMNPNMPPNPIMDVISELQVGDSIAVDMSPEMMGQQGGTDTITYHIGVIKKYSADDFAALQAEEQMKQKAILDNKTIEMKQLYNDVQESKYKDQILTTKSGLKYIILKEGSGDYPTVGENVNVEYYGMFERDGNMFDASYKRPGAFSFPLGTGRVIPGWDEGIALLKKGTEALLIVPPTLGYGEQGQGEIKGDDVLYFYVKVVE